MNRRALLGSPLMVDESVADILRTFDPFLRLVRQWVLHGGQSSDMVAAEVEDAQGRVTKLVIRRPHADVNWGNPHRIANEFHALAALARAGVVAPTPLFWTRGPTVIRLTIW